MVSRKNWVRELLVYKGAIEMGSSVLVAVKKLNSSFQDYEREFKTEVNVIGQTH